MAPLLSESLSEHFIGQIDFMAKTPLYLFLRSLAPHWAKRLYHRARGKRNSQRTSAEVFSEIYTSKQWGSAGEFNSGAGTLRDDISAPYFEAIKNFLSQKDCLKTRFVDLGCGDFRIGRLMATLSDTYIGCEVVPALVTHLQSNYGNASTKFTCVDMISDHLPEGEVCFIRQVFQHLSNEQILKVLPKLTRFKHVFITEHIPNRAKPFSPNLNKDQGPDIRLYWNSGVILSESPFNISKDKLTEILSVPGTPVWEGQDPGEIVTWVYSPNS